MADRKGRNINKSSKQMCESRKTKEILHWAVACPNPSVLSCTKKQKRKS